MPSVRVSFEFFLYLTSIKCSISDKPVYHTYTHTSIYVCQKVAEEGVGCCQKKNVKKHEATIIMATSSLLPPLARVGSAGKDDTLFGADKTGDGWVVSNSRRLSIISS